MERKLIIVGILVILILACLAAYYNSPKGDFIWDDINLVVLDYQIKSWNFLKEVFTRDFFGFSDDSRKYGYYRPLVTISYALDWRLWGLNPAGYHWTNVTLHVVCVILLFFIFYRLLNRTLLIPTLASLFFAVHPIHTESVTWIAGRTDVVCALFFFSGFLIYQVVAERLAAAKNYLPAPPGTAAGAEHRPWIWMMLVHLVLFITGMLAKEMIVALPVVTAAYTFVFITGWKWTRIKTFIPVVLLQGAATGGYFLFRYFRVGYSQQAKDPYELITTLLSFIKTIGYYVLKMLVPVSLSAYIQNPLVESVFDPKFIAAFFFLALFVFIIWRTFQSDKLVSFSLIFLLGSLLPLSNFVRISGPKDMGFMTAERFAYIPSAAFCLIIAIPIGRLIGRLGALLADIDWSARSGRRLVALVVVLTMIASFTALSINRNRDWYDNERLFNQMIAGAPNAVLLYVVLGNIYRINKKYDDAEKVLQKALEYIAPRDREEPTWIYNDLAGIYAEQRRFDEALRVMKLASRTRTHNSAVLYNYGEIYRAMNDCRTAIRYYQRSLSIYRENHSALVKLGMCYQSFNNWELANKAFLSALTLTPHDANLLHQIGYNYYRMGYLDKADVYLNYSLNERPGLIAARVALGQVLVRQNKLDEATKIIQAVLEENKDNPDANAVMGYILVKKGKLPEAGGYVMHALELQPKNIQARLIYATVALESNPAHARQVLNDLLKDAPEESEVKFVMALAYLKEKNIPEAVDWFNKTLKADPRHERARAKLIELGFAPETKIDQPEEETR